MKSLLTLAAALSVPCAFAAPDDVDTTWAASAGQIFDATDFGNVGAVLVQPDGKVIFGSNEMRATVGGNALQVPLIRINPDGTVDSTFNADNEATGAGTGISFYGQGWPEVHDLALQPDGKLIAAGVMTGYVESLGGANVGSGMSIARFNPNGTIDATFQTQGTVASGGLNYINDVEVSPDGKIWCGGGFSGFRNGDGTFFSRKGIVRLNPDGSVDTAFIVDPTDFGFDSSYDGFVRDIELIPGGGAFVIISFSRGFTTQGTFIAKIRSDGSRDAAFAPNFPTNVSVQALDLDRNGRLMAVGSAGSTTPFMQRYLPNASMDSSFALDASLGAVGNEQLEADEFGRYYLTTKNAAGNGRLVRINSNGSLDASFEAISDHPTAPIASKGNFRAPTLSPDGSLYAGAFFDTVNNVSTKKIVKFEGISSPTATGTIRVGTLAVSGLESGGTVTIPVLRSGGINGAANVSFSLSGGNATANTDYLEATGNVLFADGKGGTKYVTIELLDDSTVEGDEIFNFVISNATGATLGSTTSTITILDDDSPPSIIAQPIDATAIVGQFAKFDVTPRSPVPVSYQWQKDGQDIPGATGSIYTTPALVLTDTGSTFRVVVTNANGSVTSTEASLTVTEPDGTSDGIFNLPNLARADAAMLETATDNVVLARLQTVGGIRQYALTRIDTGGVTDSAFNVTVSRADNGFPSILSLTPTLAGKFYVAGNFDQINGATAGPNLARLNADGSLDTTFTTPDPSKFFDPVFVDSSDRLYLNLGQFGTNTGLHRVNDDGSLDPTFSNRAGSGRNGSVRMIREDSNGDLVVLYTFDDRGLKYYVDRISQSNGSIVPGFTTAEVVFSSRAIATLQDGGIAVGTSNAVRILNTDGSTRRDISLIGTVNRVIDSIIESKGQLIVSSQSVSPAASNIQQNQLIRVSLDGTIDQGFPGGDGPTGGNLRFTDIDSQGRIVIAGSFTSYNGVSHPSLARLKMDDAIISLTGANIAVLETAGQIELTVERYGAFDDAVTIDYATVAGTASPPADFTATNGTLSWAAGDNSPRTVSIPLVDDSAQDGDQTFIFELVPSPTVDIGNSSVTITIRDDESLPQVTAAPATQSIVEGFDETLTVTVADTSGVTYQWLKDGAELSGETSATLAITSADSSSAGTYQVRVTNSYGSVLTDPAIISVVPDPSTIAAGFTGASGINGSVFAIENAPGGGAYIVGNFTVTGRNPHVARLNADGSIDTTFNPPALNNWVNDIVVEADGSVIIVGQFTSLTPTGGRRIARLSSDGTLDTAFNANIADGPSGVLESVDILPDGRLAVGGTISNWNGISRGSRRHLVLLNADGTLVSNFSGGSSITYDDVRVGPDGLIYGAFDTGSSSSLKLASYDLSGTNQVNFPTSLPRVNAINFAQNGDILLGLGNSFSDGSTTGYAARYQPDGTLVRVYPVTRSVNFITEQVNGKVLVGYSGTYSGRVNISRFNTDGSLDTTFDADFPVLNGSFGSSVAHLALRADGKIWAAGAFPSFDSITTSNVALITGDAIPIAFIAQPSSQTANQGSDVTFTADATSTSTVSYQWLRNGFEITGETAPTLTLFGVTDLAEGDYTVRISSAAGSLLSEPASLFVLGAPEIVNQPMSTEVVEGSLVTLTVDSSGATPLSYQWKKDGNTIPGAMGATYELGSATLTDAGSYTVTVSNGLGSITSDAAIVEVLSNPVEVVAGYTSPTFNNDVSRVVPLDGGRVLVGGKFTTVSDGTNSATAPLVIVDEAGAVVPIAGLSVNGAVIDIEQQADGKWVIAGQFTQVNGQARSQVARLNADFSLDPTFVTTESNYNGFVAMHDLAIDPDGKIMVAAGAFNNQMIRFNTDGSRDTAFQCTANSFVQHVLPQADGKYIIAGWFSGYGGGTTANYLVRLNNDGSLDTTINYQPSVTFSGELTPLAGGTFLHHAGFAGAVEVINPDGTRNTSLLPNLPTPNQVVHSAAVDSAGRYYIGGNFTRVGSTSSGRFARLSPTGEVDTDFAVGTGFNAAVLDLALADNGRLWVGGSFTSYRGATVSRLALLKGSFTPTSGTVDDIPSFGDFVANLPVDQRDPADNPDGDYWNNGLEYLFSTNPASRETAADIYAEFIWETANTPAAELGLSDGKVYFTHTFRVPNEKVDINWSVQSSRNLFNSPSTPAIEASKTVGTDYTTYTFRMPWPTDDPAGRGFLRIVVNP